MEDEFASFNFIDIENPVEESSNERQDLLGKELLFQNQVFIPLEIECHLKKSQDQY